MDTDCAAYVTSFINILVAYFSPSCRNKWPWYIYIDFPLFAYFKTLFSNLIWATAHIFRLDKSPSAPLVLLVLIYSQWNCSIVALVEQAWNKRSTGKTEKFFFKGSRKSQIHPQVESHTIVHSSYNKCSILWNGRLKLKVKNKVKKQESNLYGKK